MRWSLANLDLLVCDLDSPWSLLSVYFPAKTVWVASVSASALIPTQVHVQRRGGARTLPFIQLMLKQLLVTKPASWGTRVQTGKSNDRYVLGPCHSEECKQLLRLCVKSTKVRNYVDVYRFVKNNTYSSVHNCSKTIFTAAFGCYRATRWNLLSDPLSEG